MTLDQAQQLADDPMGTWFADDVATNIEVISERFGCDVLLNTSDHPFLTSDSPAVIHFPPREPRFRMMPQGLGSPGCEITLPMSPRSALLFRHKAPGLYSFMEANREMVYEVNLRTITRARERIVSDRSDISFVQEITGMMAEHASG